MIAPEHLMFKRTLDSKIQLSTSPHGSSIFQADHDEPTNPMIRRRNLWLLFGVFALTALLRIGVAGQSGLWGDEIFSLAMATGHSLEHPAAAANTTL